MTIQPQSTGPWHLPGDVPDGHWLARGGAKPMPPPGNPFSASAGPTPEDACRGVPHGQVRLARAGDVRERDGTIEVRPEPARDGRVNHRHVDVAEGRGGSFGELRPNPVPKGDRLA